MDEPKKFVKNKPIVSNHTPNAETIASIESSERGEGVKSFGSIDDLFEDLGI